MNKNSQGFVWLNTQGFFKLVFPFLHFLHFSLLLHMQRDPGNLSSDFSNPRWVPICYIGGKKISVFPADAHGYCLSHLPPPYSSALMDLLTSSTNLDVKSNSRMMRHGFSAWTVCFLSFTVSGWVTCRRLWKSWIEVEGLDGHPPPSPHPFHITGLWLDTWLLYWKLHFPAACGCMSACSCHQVHCAGMQTEVMGSLLSLFLNTLHHPRNQACRWGWIPKWQPSNRMDRTWVPEWPHGAEQPSHLGPLTERLIWERVNVCALQVTLW